MSSKFDVVDVLISLFDDNRWRVYSVFDAVSIHLTIHNKFNFKNKLHHSLLALHRREHGPCAHQTKRGRFIWSPGLSRWIDSLSNSARWHKLRTTSENRFTSFFLPWSSTNVVRLYGVAGDTAYHHYWPGKKQRSTFVDPWVRFFYNCIPAAKNLTGFLIKLTRWSSVRGA